MTVYQPNSSLFTQKRGGCENKVYQDINADLTAAKINFDSIKIKLNNARQYFEQEVEMFKRLGLKNCQEMDEFICIVRHYLDVFNQQVNELED